MYVQSQPYLDALYQTAAEKQKALETEQARQLELKSAETKGGDVID